MGLSVREVLRSKEFENYQLIAGSKGLNNSIQGVAIIDAPDAFQWNRGKEFAISSGYLFSKNPNLINEFLADENFRGIACLGIKQRYVKEFPQEILAEFDRLAIPLLIIPPEFSWMDIINHLNVIVMNKNIRQFRIGSLNLKNSSNASYQGRKINKILSNMENELNFPAMLYDVSNAISYYSSNSFVKFAKYSDEEDFWNPRFEHHKEILCDNLNMVRYRYEDDRFDQPYSWITIPVKVGQEVKAYFVLVEETSLIDYFDQFSIRIGFLLLQSLYEQITALSIFENRGFEKLIQDLLSGLLSAPDAIIRRANEIYINEKDQYYMALIESRDESSPFDETLLTRTLNKSLAQIEGYRSVLLDNQTSLVIIPHQLASGQMLDKKLMKELLWEIQATLVKLQDSELIRIGYSDIAEDIFETSRNYQRAKQSLLMGRILKEDQKVTAYSELGPFAWLKLPEEEIEVFKEKINLLKLEDNPDDLIETLKYYLRNNLNYSQTAKDLFVHINTVRHRIAHIREVVNIDLDNAFERLGLEIAMELFY